MIVQPELGLGLELHRAKYVSLSLGAQNKAGVIRYGRNLTHLARDGVYGERENAHSLPLASCFLKPLLRISNVPGFYQVSCGRERNVWTGIRFFLGYEWFWSTFES